MTVYDITDTTLFFSSGQVNLPPDTSAPTGLSLPPLSSLHTNYSFVFVTVTTASSSSALPSSPPKTYWLSTKSDDVLDWCLLHPLFTLLHIYSHHVWKHRDSFSHHDARQSATLAPGHRPRSTTRLARHTLTSLRCSRCVCARDSSPCCHTPVLHTHQLPAASFSAKFSDDWTGCQTLAEAEWCVGAHSFAVGGNCHGSDCDADDEQVRVECRQRRQAQRDEGQCCHSEW